ncbi:hypothetical protein B0H13DRAFT_1850646 [Mycena leptocephala]|nr:hypothetical protein B0H13DRAFT_1850646 [Mycena leptocephala]
MDSVAATLPSAVLDAPRKNIERGSTEDIVFEGQAVRLQGVQLVTLAFTGLVVLTAPFAVCSAEFAGFKWAISIAEGSSHHHLAPIAITCAANTHTWFTFTQEMTSILAVPPSRATSTVTFRREEYIYLSQERSSGERNDVAGADCSCAGPLKFGEEVADHSSGMVNRRSLPPGRVSVSERAKEKEKKNPVFYTGELGSSCVSVEKTRVE